MTDSYKPLTKEDVDFINKREPSTAIIFEYKVRSAVEGLKEQFAALSGFAAGNYNVQEEKAYDNALSLLDEWFPVFETEDKK